MEEKIRNAILDELKRQSAESGLQVRTEGDGLTLNGPIDLDALVMVVIGSVAGGP